MGITGLIPFLDKASSAVNINQLEGSSVAVDSYCWLHKGVFACAEKLVRGETTNVHIQYCLKYVDMLLKHNIIVIMVFDGRHLPAKAETERRRREARNESKRLSKEYLRRNDIEKARTHMRRAVDVTHEMALELIKACRDRFVDCIVAPYEADAQMAWLNDKGLVDYVVTEDSDLTLFGAKKILFKLDLTGQALLVENSKLYLAMGCRPEKYTFDKFRRMCILSGCDYLDSLQGIGLKKARKFILNTEESDMRKALKKIPSCLQMKQLEVTNEYIEAFLKAEATFRHMFIYNPLQRRMERLHELEEYQTEESLCSNAGSLLNDSEQAFQLALGNLNPFTLKQLDNWHPNRNWPQNKLKHKSIWLVSMNSQLEEKKKKTESIFHFKKIEFKNMAEIEIAEKVSEERSKLEESEIFSIYKYAEPKTERKRKRRQSSSSGSEDCEIENKVVSVEEPKQSSHNPFVKVGTSLENKEKSPVCSNNSLLKHLSPKKPNANIDNMTELKKTPVKSRFFAGNMKLVLKKPFAARDLTSEMLQIEKKTNEYIEQQRDLYHCSLESPEKRIIGAPKSFDDPLAGNSNQSSYKKNSSTSDIESDISSQGTSTVLSSKEEIILLSDMEEDFTQKSSVQKFANTTQKSSKQVVYKTKCKSQTKPRKPVKALQTIDINQSKLSMFGFQKRPLLKKL